MKLLVDTNQSPKWVVLLKKHGVDAVHWSQIGSGNAPDSQIFAHVREENLVVLTHDLDFSAILFHSQAKAPSVIQLRSEDTRPSVMGEVVVSSIRSTESDLKSGALHRSSTKPI